MPRGRPGPELEKVREILRLYFDLNQRQIGLEQQLIQRLLARWDQERQQEEE